MWGVKIRTQDAGTDIDGMSELLIMSEETTDKSGDGEERK